MDKAIVLGVGPVDGLGGQLAVRFAASGHHVFVAGRTQASLDELSRSRPLSTCLKPLTPKRVT